MATQSIELIPLENLAIDLFNPRHEHQPSQRDAIHEIAHDHGEKLLALAEDIVNMGLNPAELPIVTSSDEQDMYSVLEGNRRIAALKLLASPQLLASMNLSQKLDAAYKDLQKRAGQDIPSAINCVVLSREDSVHWINLKHTGENAGVGIVPWDGMQTQRFRGESPALQAIEMVKGSKYIDDETRKKLPKIAITNVERVLGTPEARQALGVSVKGNQLSLSSTNEEEALARLAILVSEIANKVIKVTDLDSKPQRVDYAKRIASMPAPTPGQSTGSGKVAGAAQKPGAVRRASPYRTTVIPRDFKLSIHQTRINQIFHELQTMKVEDFRNSCAVMVRVFVELSVDHYAEVNKISLKVAPGSTPGGHSEKELKLYQKINKVADYLEANKICDKTQLQGVRSLVSHKGHYLSLESLNAYVHNKEFNPSASDLKANWDSIEAFMRTLWAS